MSISRFLLLLSFVSCLVVTQVKAAEPSSPNVLILLCDDLGYGDLQCFGHPHIKTPSLNKLASQGMRLTDCYSTAPVCSSSRAGLMTGRTPNRSGIYDWIPDGHPTHLKAEETTLAEVARNGGYRTGMFGKWHLNGRFNQDDTPQPDDHGFDTWYATQNNASPSHANPGNFVRNGNSVGPQEGFSCQLVATEAIRWMTEPKSEQPFFAFVCFHEPHEPVASPPDLVKKYLPVAENENQAQYFANVENMDRAVGRIIEAIDNAGVGENTLVYFSSDNGPETLNRYPNARRSWGTPGPLREMKLHIYDGGIRVPGIVRWPAKVAPHQVINTPVCALDLMPTLCELLEQPLPEKPLDGTSLVSFLAGNDLNRKEPLFWHYYRALTRPKVAMRDGRWKLVGFWDGPHMIEAGSSVGRNVNSKSVEIVKTAQLVEFELYDMQSDIAEQNNVAAQHPEVMSQLKQAMLKKYAEVQQESPLWPKADAYWEAQAEIRRQRQLQNRKQKAATKKQ